MANIIPSEQVDTQVQRAVFGGTVPAPDAGQPLSAPHVDRRGMALPGAEAARPLPAPEPEPAPQPQAQAQAQPQPQAAPEPPPAEPPVFEVPAEILQGVYDQAVAQGLEDGKNQVFAELTVLQERYAGCIDQLVGVSKELQAQNRVQLLSLACTIAEKLVRSHLRANPADLLTLVDEVLQQVEGEDEVIVAVGPDDHQYLVERRQQLIDGIGGAFKIKVIADPKLEYGDFRVETRLGATDGRVASRMAEAEGALRGADV